MSEEYQDEIKISCMDGCNKKCKVRRTFEKAKPVISIGEGFLGNAKDGYTGGSATYIPSPFTPLKSAFKGGRTAGVETEHNY